MRIVLLATLLFLGAVAIAHAAPARCYDWILKEKLRGGYLSCADLKPELAQVQAAGMNALLPKVAGLHAEPTESDSELLQAWGDAGAQYHVHVLPVFNFRGGETEKILSDRCEVTPGGQTLKRTPCPLDEAFWQKYVLGRAVFLARHAKEFGLAGAVLDPEMYGADHSVYGSVCYCDWCLREFLQAEGKAVPAPLPATDQRLAWLKAQGLSERFEQHYVARVKQLSALVERECHAANPDFLLGVLLLDYPLPFMKGLALGMGTATYPVLGFSETTYSPGYTDYVDKQPQVFAAMPAEVLFVPGLWQQQFPSENLAEQYYACAAHSAGYWIYTLESMLEDVSKLPGYALGEPLERYWEAIKVANRELDKLQASGGTYVSTLQVRPFDPPAPAVSTGDLLMPNLVPAPDRQPVAAGPFTAPRLRYRNPLYILGKAGEPITVKVENRQLASYRPGTQWVLLGPDGKQLLEGHLKVRESAEAKFTPERDGVYVLVAQSGQNSHVLTLTTGQSNAYVATAKHKLTVNGQFGRMYFYVPAGSTAFTITAKAEGQAAGRGGKLKVIAPDGQVIAHLEGDLGGPTEMPVTVPAALAGRVWCLQAEDVTNDLTIFLSGGVAPYLSPDPTKALATQP